MFALHGDSNRYGSYGQGYTELLPGATLPGHAQA
jgi:hypothetical protein